MEDFSGQQIKGYELVQLIGEGGFGQVYRAFQPLIKREVAMKVILPEFANHPDFIRSFEHEAQLIARLEHIHIVPLFDYWRDPDGAYLVMRWLRGGSLSRLIEKQGRLEPTKAAQVLDQVASALSVAHRNGVIHRDIKPDNILLDEDGNAYLTDFGIAKDLKSDSTDSSEGESITGSPYYLSPEQALGDPDNPISVQSDIYSLGIVLYEMLTGEKPFEATLGLMQMLLKQINEPLPPVHIVNPALPESFDEVVQLATAKEPAERFSDVLTFATAFRQAVKGEQVVTVIEETAEEIPEIQVLAGITISVGNPFKGLRPFEEADSQDFFGRNELTRRLLERMIEEHPFDNFLAVIGPSGSGKSSVVKAGLMPILRRGAMPGSERWFVCSMTPGSNPFQELESALLSVAIGRYPNIRQDLRKDEHGLLTVAHQILPRDDSELLLVIDQFEEVFTLVEEESTRAAFLSRLLVAVTDSESRLRVIITMRADFYDRPLHYPGFGELIRQRSEVVLPLSPEEMEEAIVAPVERVGLKVEAALVSAIVTELTEQPGALPLLQYALTEVFERRQSDTLTVDAYNESGGVMGALARRAEEIFVQLEEAEQNTTRQVFLRLVTLGEGTEDTRRRVSQASLLSIGTDEEITQRVLDVYSKYRLLTYDNDPATREPTVEVAHEALIREWERLRKWLNSSRESVRIQQRLGGAATEWRNSNHESSYLASGIRLSQFEEWVAQTDLALTPEERHYLEASIQRRESLQQAENARKAREAAIAKRAQRFRMATFVLAILGGLSVCAAVFASIQANNALTDAERAGEQVQAAGETLTPVQLTLQSAGTSVAFSGTEIYAVGLTLTPIPATIESANLRLTEVAEEIVRQNAIVESQRLAVEANSLIDSDGDLELAALVNIRALNTAYSPLADAVLVKTVDRLYTKKLFTGANVTDVTDVNYSPDGTQLLIRTRGNALRIVDTEAGNLTREFSESEDRLDLAVYSPDGMFIVVATRSGALQFWDVESGQIVRTLIGHTARITSIDFSSDGTKVLTGSDDGTVRLWSFQTGLEERIFIFETTVWGAAFSPDEQTIYVGSGDGLIQATNIETGNLIDVIGEQEGATLFKLLVHPDGQHLITMGIEGTLSPLIQVWDVQTGEARHRFIGHEDIVSTIALSPDGRYLMTGSGSQDRTARLWNTLTGEALIVFDLHTDAVISVGFSPDGSTLFSASKDNTLRLWNPQINTETRILNDHTAGVTSATFSPDGHYLLTASRDTTARLWDFATRQTLLVFSGHTDGVLGAVFSPDGNIVLTHGQDNTARLWDTKTSAELRQFPHFYSQPAPLFSPNGRYVLTSSEDNVLHLWDVETGEEVHAFSGHASVLTSTVFSPDSTFILTGSQDATVRVWDVATGGERYIFEEHHDWLTDAVISTDGKTAFSVSFDNAAYWWEVESGRVLASFSLPFSFQKAEFLKASNRVLIRSRDSMVIWDLEAEAIAVEFKGHTDSIRSEALSVDERFLVTGSADNTARLWDTATGEQIRIFAGHENRVMDVAFSPDRRVVLTASEDGTARLWQRDYRDFVVEACSRVFRDFTTQERQIFGIQDNEPTCPQFAE